MKKLFIFDWSSAALMHKNSYSVTYLILKGIALFKTTSKRAEGFSITTIFFNIPGQTYP